MSESDWRGGPLLCRGVRGATTASADTPEAIYSATQDLLQAMVEANGIAEADVASVFVTGTPDLTAAYPATGIRLAGWTDVALMGAQEVAPPDSPARCIRLLIHWNTTVSQQAIRHVYINGAESLRPDRAGTER